MKKAIVVLLALIVALVVLPSCKSGIDPTLFEKQLAPLRAHHLKLLPNEPDEMKREDVAKGWEKVFANLAKAKGGDS